MDDLRKQLLRGVEEPEEMEALYRSRPEEFAAALPHALEQRPESILLRAWRARLAEPEKLVAAAADRHLWVMILFCLAAGGLVKLGMQIGWRDHAWLVRLLYMAPYAALLVYWLFVQGWPGLRTAGTLVGSACLAGLVAVIPPAWDDTLILAELHLALAFWSIYGVARLGRAWRDTRARLGFISFTGQFVVMAGLLALGGIILVVLTLALLSALSFPTSYAEKWLAVFGLAAIPLVAAWANDQYDAAKKISPVIARLFTPLVLVLLVAYMAVMAISYQELFNDRETLLIFNILLLIVLALSVYGLTEAGGLGLGRGQVLMVTAMLGLSVLLDLVALSSIGWRIAQLGLTANRLAVAGSNVLVLGNLVTMLHALLRGQVRGSPQRLGRAVAGYLGIYFTWTVLVVAVFPWVFRY